MDEARTQHVEPITERHLEVARLIAAGRTNPEIAEDLGITLAGAKYHVSELLGRLGLERREEIAAWYREQRGTPLTRARRRVRAIGVGPLLAWGGSTAVAVVAVVALVVALEGAREGGGGAAAGVIPTPSVAEPVDVLHIDDLPQGTVRTFELMVEGLFEREPNPETWFTTEASPYGFHLAHLPSGEVRAYWWGDTRQGWRTFWSADYPWPDQPPDWEDLFADPDGMFYARHGALFNIESERLIGPSGPRRFDQFEVEVRPDGRTWVDLATIIDGVPFERSSLDVTPPPTSIATPAPTSIAPLYHEYEVQSGDTLESVAQDFGLSPESVLRNNPSLADSTATLERGMRLRLVPDDGMLHPYSGDATMGESSLRSTVSANPISSAISPMSVLWTPGCYARER